LDPGGGGPATPGDDDNGDEGDKGDENDTPGEDPGDDDEDGGEGTVWTILVEDGFEGELKTPLGVSYLVYIHVGLYAEKEGGTSPRGIYQGNIEITTEINEESFIAAMNSLGGEPITGMESNISIETAEVAFSVVEYDANSMIDANAQFSSGDTPPMIAHLMPPQGMVISSFSPVVTQSIVIRAGEGSGSTNVGGAGEVPFLIDISSEGRVKLYLPRLLQMMNRNTFSGRLERPE
ncbi:MAG: hypothetical protein PHS56_09985, partial [Eubacteriales bacterium]|nr:hypothetical protein [Eubacteriales bacterium]